MSQITRRIGLSLGADLCWPLCYEAIVKRLAPAFSIGGDTINIEVERVPIEPFSLSKPVDYDVILDRLTHWYHARREWVKKAILMDGVYVLNNPWALQSMEKQTTYCAMMRLGLPVPDTWMVPPKEYAPVEDLESTLQRYARMFDLGKIGSQLGYPMFMKPYDGGAWKGVSRIDDEGQLRAAYEQSGRMLMHLQKAVDPFDSFVRCIGVGPQVRHVSYDPSAPLHARYRVEDDELSDSDRQQLEDMTLTINSFFCWDFNSCEGLRQDGVWYPIDFANACPDSQVTSLHYHFPWLVLAKIRWSLFCAATKRPMRMNQDWAPFFALADETEGAPLPERLAAYGALARERLQAREFGAFCDEHLSELDAIAREYFGSDEARDTVRQKVASLFPEHEVDGFTEHFWQLIQRWRGEPAPTSVLSDATSAGAPATAKRGTADA